MTKKHVFHSRGFERKIFFALFKSYLKNLPRIPNQPTIKTIMKRKVESIKDLFA